MFSCAKKGYIDDNSPLIPNLREGYHLKGFTIKMTEKSGPDASQKVP